VEGFVAIYFQLCLEYRSWIFLAAEKRMEQKRNTPTPILVFADIIGCIRRNLEMSRRKTQEIFQTIFVKGFGLEVNVEKTKWRFYIRDS